MNIFEDPSEERLAKFIRDGQIKTWPTICMIRNRFKVETLLMLLRNNGVVSKNPYEFVKTKNDIYKSNSCSTCHNVDQVISSCDLEKFTDLITDACNTATKAPSLIIQEGMPSEKDFACNLIAIWWDPCGHGCNIFLCFDIFM